MRIETARSGQVTRPGLQLINIEINFSNSEVESCQETGKVDLVFPPPYIREKPRNNTQSPRLFSFHFLENNQISNIICDYLLTTYFDTPRGRNLNSSSLLSKQAVNIKGTSTALSRYFRHGRLDLLLELTGTWEIPHSLSLDKKPTNMISVQLATEYMRETRTVFTAC
jgi:hypothetical protein